jgi:starvation-inducible DNA-binding protein
MAFTSPRMNPSEAHKVVDVLHERLASLIDLSMTLKHIHWNVVGPNFIGVHEMLDPQYQAVAGFVDDIAERIATLGGEPLGTPGAVIRRRTWDDYSINRADAQAHLGALDLVYNGVVAGHGDGIHATKDVDLVTEGMLIAQTEQLEMFQWFVRAHLEDAGGELAHAGAKTERDAAKRAGAATGGTKKARASRAGAGNGAKARR